MTSDQKTASTFFIRIASLIPGYKSYNSKENFRINDYEIRKFCSRKLNKKKESYNNLKKQAVLDNQHELVLKLDKAQTLLRNFSDKIRLSKHGYSAIFKDNLVDEARLKQVVENDEKLISLVEKMSEDSNYLPIEEIIQTTEAIMDEMKDILETREEILR
jgi:hypothetical protein|tara:strand:- start:240 stop:719 length:480 start_codon:yes stop_codon:yes gene_type:complete